MRLSLWRKSQWARSFTLHCFEALRLLTSSSAQTDTVVDRLVKIVSTAFASRDPSTSAWLSTPPAVAMHDAIVVLYSFCHAQLVLGSLA
jgi:hypothetical protein